MTNIPSLIERRRSSVLDLCLAFVLATLFVWSWAIIFIPSLIMNFFAPRQHCVKRHWWHDIEGPGY